MTTSTADVQNTENPFTRPAKRDIAPSGSNVLASGSNVLEDMFSFILDTPGDALPDTEIDPLITLLGDLEYLDKRQINESLHFAKKSSTGARSIARKWYSANRGRVAKGSRKNNFTFLTDKLSSSNLALRCIVST